MELDNTVERRRKTYLAGVREQHDIGTFARIVSRAIVPNVEQVLVRASFLVAAATVQPETN